MFGDRDRHRAADHDALVEHVIEQVTEHELLDVDLIIVIRHCVVSFTK